MGFNALSQNSIIEIATLAELDKQEKSSSRQDQVLAQLYRTMRWCASRQVLGELASGTYRTSLSPVNVQSFVRGTVEDKDHVDLSIVDETIGIGTVIFDETMAWVILENAMNNALEHGDGKVCLSIKYSPITNAITFSIENKVQEGEFKRERSHSPTIEDLTDSDAILRSKRPPSTHCGMSHVALACQGAGGISRLEFNSNAAGEQVAVFTVSIPAMVSTSCPEETSANPDNEPTMVLPKKLKLCALDDSNIICKGIDRILFKALGADCDKSFVCCPRNEADVLAFMDQILFPPPPAEIVLLDQNIDLEDGTPRMLGTTLADELRLRGYEGLLVIRSANAAVSDDKEYLRSGSVDVCIGKHETQKKSVEMIVKAYYSKNKTKHDHYSLSG